MDQKFLDAMNGLLKLAADSTKPVEAYEAQMALAAALQTPLREGVLSGDIISPIYTRQMVGPGGFEFPLDLLAPGTEKDHVAYAVPRTGRIPENAVQGDYVRVPTFDIANSIDVSLKYIRDANWAVTTRMMEVLESGFVKKNNDDGMHVVLGAGVDRNILVYDSDASSGQLTKRLISLMKLFMRRNAGGNSTSVNRGKLTDIMLSPDAMEDIRNWGVDIVDEVTRREIYMAADGMVNRIFGVNLHDIDELGTGQEYQLFFENVLGGSVASGDVEVVIGLDLSGSDSFYMPIREEVAVTADPYFHRQNRASWYARAEHGFGCLDNRKVILGSL